MAEAKQLGPSYAQALNIWIQRFKTAQTVIRELEAENEVLRTRLGERENPGDGSTGD